MKTLIFTLFSLLVTFNAYSQRDTIRLCDLSVERRYNVKSLQGATVEWHISPDVQHIVSYDTRAIVVTWKDIGSYIITASYLSNPCQGPNGYKIVDVVECPQTVFWVPNSFTPNYDERNEEFSPKGLNVFEYRMRIFDRWGELIFETTDLKKGWAGPAYELSNIIDVYTYHIVYRDINKKFHSLYGRVTLVK